MLYMRIVYWHIYEQWKNRTCKDKSVLSYESVMNHWFMIADEKPQSSVGL